MSYFCTRCDGTGRILCADGTLADCYRCNGSGHEPEPQVSKGHVCFSGDFEYFVGEDTSLYRALRNNPLTTRGYRNGARFECYAHMTASRVAMLD